MAAISQAKRVVIYGGRGALGTACIAAFKAKDWWVGSIDLQSNEDADANIIVTPKDQWAAQYEEVANGMEAVLKNEEKIDALICVAGGWAGGNAKSEDLIHNSDKMWKQSVWPSVISAGIAARYLKEGGLLSLPGAKAGLQGTPGMIGYGLAKAAVHQLVSSLAKKSSGMPDESVVVGILPLTLDTPMNRKAMPNADFSSWTPTLYVAELLVSWASKVDRPSTGTLAHITTEEGITKIHFG